MFQQWLKQIHWPLVIAAGCLVSLGSLFIYSASFHDAGQYEVKQMFWAAAALLVLFAGPFFGYRTFLSISLFLYVIAIGMLLWVLLAGAVRLGAQRWIVLGPLVLQPSEFAKLATVLALADFLGSHQAWENDRKVIPVAIGMVLLPFILVVKQPDLGSALIFLPLVLTVLFLWGIRYRYLIGTILFGILAAPIGWNFLKEYQKKRILVFLDPTNDPLGSGYTAIQSRIAVGSGGLWGKGIFKGTQSQLQFVPEHHTDFIFCVIGEEWGFVGSLLLLLCYGLLFQASFQVMEQTTDMKAKLLIAGVVSVIFSQIFINIGMTFGLMPITGITLPLVSYGGSSLITVAFALGLILSIYKERSIF